jgi:uncharacterized protein
LSIARKAKAVEKLYIELDAEITAFRKETGISCISGCGKCCLKPDIEATILEFIPLAYHLFKDGKAEEILEKLRTDTQNNICINFTLFVVGSGSGMCSSYVHRGLICRLFGYSARIDKNGNKQFITCKPIKETQAESYNNAVKRVADNMYIPVMSNYYYKLKSIDHRLAEKFYPINTAIKLAIEHVIMYYIYRTRKAS